MTTKIKNVAVAPVEQVAPDTSNTEAINKAVQEVFTLVAERNKLQARIDEINEQLKPYNLPSGFDKTISATSPASKKEPAKEALTESELATIQEFVKDEPQQLKKVGEHIKIHPLTLKRLLNKNTSFRIATNDNKAMLSYTGK